VTTKIIDKVFNELRMDVLCDLKAPSQIETPPEIKPAAQVLSFDKMGVFAGTNSSARCFYAYCGKPYFNKLTQCTSCPASKIDDRCRFGELDNANRFAGRMQ